MQQKWNDETQEKGFAKHNAKQSYMIIATTPLTSIYLMKVLEKHLTY